MSFVLRPPIETENEQVSQVVITVTGENKPGRMTVSVTDLTVPVTGIPITIQRQYDSLERNQIGDFGYGWALEMSGPRLEVSPDNDVTITEPGTGKRRDIPVHADVFWFPVQLPLSTSLHARTRRFRQADLRRLWPADSGPEAASQCFLSLDINYSPTVFAYTDPYGRVYTMTAAGKMLSIKNLDGTFSPLARTASPAAPAILRWRLARCAGSHRADHGSDG